MFAARFDAQVSADLEQNPEAAEYARRVEDDLGEDLEDVVEQADELPNADEMVDELERFLRQQREDQD